MALDELLEAVAPYTKCSRRRLEAMAKACQYIDAEEIEGDVVECGVWRGGNMILARKLCPGRVLWMYDTFAGMWNQHKCDVTPSGHRLKEGKGAVSLEQVKDNFKQMNAWDGPDASLQFVEGPVEKTLDFDSCVPKKIALLRLDTDWYWSTRKELEVLWPRLEPGGVLIVDDYGHWLGARKAVDEFFETTLSFQKIDYTAIQMVKPSA